MSPTVSVIVPTLRRPEQLAACLQGLAGQRRPAEEIVVVRRADDEATARLLGTLAAGAVTSAVVDRPGVVAALRAGAEASRGQVIAVTDDDAIPRPDWLERLVAPYGRPEVGAVGGRDIVHHGDVVEDGAESAVGLVSPFGRITGAHHLGAGTLRPVDHLKGVNMSFRREALAFPTGLRGSGAEVWFELAMSLHASGRGWTLLFEPAALVDHFPGPRFDDDARGGASDRARSNSIFNSSYALFSLRPERALRRALWVTAVGDRSAPGVVRSAVAVLRGDRQLARVLPLTMTSTVSAWRTARSARMRMEAVTTVARAAADTEPAPAGAGIAAP